MNRRLMRFARLLARDIVKIAPILAIFLAVSGCATHQPTAIVIERKPVIAPDLGGEKDVKLKLLTFNIWGLPRWMTGAPAGRYPRIAQEIERINPDVALLQEAWTAKARRSVPDDGDWFLVRAAGQHTFFQQSGLVTLSKFPVVGGQFYPFSRAAFPDSVVNKGALKVTVQLPGGRLLNIWNVHMQDSGATAIREIQVHEFISWVKAAQDGQVADLVGGDFNCTPDSDSCRELVAALGPSLQQIGGNNPFITWDGLSSKPDAGQTIDYLFLRERAEFTKLTATEKVAFTSPVLQQRLSDHLGIEAVVDFNTEPGAASQVSVSADGSRFSNILAHRAP